MIAATGDSCREAWSKLSIYFDQIGEVKAKFSRIVDLACGFGGKIEIEDQACSYRFSLTRRRLGSTMSSWLNP
jgi:hypothetical protein